MRRTWSPGLTNKQESVNFEDELTDHQRALLEKMADKVVRLRMTVPAIMFLESMRPMNYVGSQVMVFFAPVVRGFFGLPDWDEVRLVLERRESIRYFLDLIEKMEGDFLVEEKKLREKRKAQRRQRREERRQRRASENEKKGNG